jgi:hypothetical protein
MSVNPPSLNRSNYSKPTFATRPQNQQQEHLRHGMPLKEDYDSPTTSPNINRHDEISHRGRPISLTEAFAATEDLRGIYLQSPPDSSFPKDTGGSLIPRPQLSPPIDRRHSPSPSLREHHSRLPRSADRERGRLRATAPSFTPSPPRGPRQTDKQVALSETRADVKVDRESGRRDQQMNGRLAASSSLRPDRVASGEHLGMERLSRSGSPASFTRTRRSSPSPDQEGGGSEAEEVDSKRDGSGSERSGYSYLQDGTDETFNRELAKHARDQERVKGALKNKRGVFSGKRVDERAGLTTENLGRESSATRTAWAKDLEQRSKAGSVTSEGSDPPVQVPRGWGSKARSRKDWMSRIPRTESREPDSLASKTGEGSALVGERRWNLSSADEVLPSIENTETFQQQTVYPSSPPERKKNDSLNRIRAWEDDEFTARDLQVSTSPPIKVKKNGSLDQIREREIEALKDRAVTTSRLGEIKQRTSHDSLNSQGDDGSKDIGDLISASDPKTPLRSSRSGGSLRRKFGKTASPSEEKVLSTTYEDEGDAIPNTPIVIFKGSSILKESEALEDEHDEARISNENNAKSSRPGLTTEDSQDLLRQLARAASTSPTLQKNERPAHTNSIDDAIKITGAETIPSSSRTRADIDSGDRDLSKKNKPSKENAREFQYFDNTPQRSGPDTVKATPKITGGWIDTPAPNKSAGLAAPFHSEAEDRILNLDIRDFHSNKQVSQKRGGFFGRFKSAKSQAKEAPALQKHNKQHDVDRSEKETLVPEDVTTDSIQEMPADDTIMTVDSIQEMLLNDASLTSILDDDTKQPEFNDINEHGQPLSAAERERRREAWKAEQLSKRLRRLQSGIHAAKRGIEGLESKVVETDDGIWQKPEGGPSVYELLRRPIALIIDEEGSLTKLGWLSVACTVLWLTESIAW